MVQNRSMEGMNNMTTVASVYDYETSDTITTGLQTADVCDEAIQSARRIAANLNKTVVLEDSDGLWIVHPDGECVEMDEDEATHWR